MHTSDLNKSAVLSSDELFMLRALELAQRGRGNVSPNPMVGCLIVCDGKIIGEGFHQKFGASHAEVNALEKVHDKSKLSSASMYVSLEPCSHYGKTPPCADLIIKNKIGKVIVCNRDPNPLVAGKGIAKLKEAGIEVEEGILAEQGKWLNRRFFTSIEQKRPYVILKWAETADGYIARHNMDSKWISGPFSRKLVHAWRGQEDAILVGKNTALYDDPALNVRDWSGRNPIRLVIDHLAQLPASLQLFNTDQLTLAFNLQKSETIANTAWIALEEESFYPQLMAALQKQKVQSLIVEGGAKTLQKFIDLGFWDEARVFKSGKISFGQGISSPRFAAKKKMESALPNGDVFSLFLKNQ